MTSPATYRCRLCGDPRQADIEEAMGADAIEEVAVRFGLDLNMLRLHIGHPPARRVSKVKVAPKPLTWTGVGELGDEELEAMAVDILTQRGADAAAEVNGKPPRSKPQAKVIPIREDEPPGDGDGPPTLFLGDHAELAQRLRWQLSPRPTIYSSGFIWRYDDEAQIWRSMPDDELGVMVQSYSGLPVRNGDKVTFVRIQEKDVGGVLKCTRRLISRPGFFDTPRDGVAFRNGFVSVDDDGKITIEPPSDDHRCRHAFPFDYAPAAPHVELDEFLDELWHNASEDERALRCACLQEFVGACLTGRAPKHQRALITLGDGDNGKSELNRVIRAFFPASGLCSLPPQKWGERFAMAVLDGKLANICDEIPEREIVSGETFKGVITGNTITAERKNRDPFEFAPRAGHIFAANKLPATGDLSRGFFRRFNILALDRNMREASSMRLEAGLYVIRRCLPGMVAWSIAGAARLAKQINYTEPECHREAMSSWRTNADSVALFVRDQTIPTEGKGTAGSTLFDHYKTYAKDGGYRMVAANSFGARLKDLHIPWHRPSEGMFYRLEYSYTGKPE